MRPLWRNLLIVALLLCSSGMAACELGVRYELAKIPPEQRARMSDTDWVGVEWIFRSMLLEAVGLLIAAAAFVGQWWERKRGAHSMAGVEVSDGGVRVRDRRGRDSFAAWSDITRIEAFKADLLIHDAVCLQLTTDELTLVVDEGAPGWDALTRALASRFPVPPEWFAAIVQPPFAENRTTLYEASRLVVESSSRRVV